MIVKLTSNNFNWKILGIHMVCFFLNLEVFIMLCSTRLSIDLTASKCVLTRYIQAEKFNFMRHRMWFSNSLCSEFWMMYFVCIINTNQRGGRPEARNIYQVEFVVYIYIWGLCVCVCVCLSVCLYVCLCLYVYFCVRACLYMWTSVSLCRVAAII